LVQIQGKNYVHKKPIVGKDIDNYIAKLKENRIFFTLLNKFNFFIKLNYWQSFGESKGLIMEYLSPGEWQKISSLKLSQQQIENLMGQILNSMKIFNEMELSICLIHQENIFISRDFKIKYIDRDDLDCMIGLNKYRNRSQDLLAFITIFSENKFMNNNKAHKKFINNILELAKNLNSASELLEKRQLKFDKSYINEISAAEKIKLSSMVKKIRAKLKKEHSEQQKNEFIKVEQFLNKNGITKYDAIELVKFYKSMIKHAHDKSGEDEFAYDLGHGEIKSGFSYYGDYEGFTKEPATADKKAIFDNWLKVFRAMPIEWAQ
jgi:hypothetical protein